MAGSNFADEVRSVFSDTQNLPADFLNYLIQNQSLNPVPLPKTSGQRIAIGTKSSSVSTAGTTFAAGADLLTSALEFTAIGGNSYIIRCEASDWTNNTAGAGNFLRLNLDGADGGYLGIDTTGTSLFKCYGSILIQPSAGTHAVNVRLTVGSGTGTINAGGTGAGARGPIIVTIEVA